MVVPVVQSAERTLRVLVDGRELTGMGRYSGLGTFTRSLLGALSRQGSVDVRVLTTDPASGVLRHADAGYEEALDEAERQGLELLMRRHCAE